jgi:hypothetical protein
MKQLVIKNVGPIRQVDIKLNRFNFFIGPQSSGKSTVAKILSSCMWLEKEVLTTLNDKVLADGAAFVRLVESFHKIEGYFEDGSFVQYDTDCISIMYCDKDIKITRKENEDYRREKICYIPAERNMVTLPELQGFEFGHTNIRSFLFDWFNAREFFVAGNKTDVLNLGVKYYYDSEQSKIKDRIEHVNGRTYQIALSSASSGLQSLTPLLVMLQYYTDEYFRSYNEKRSFAADTKLKKTISTLLSEFNENREMPNSKDEERARLAQEVNIQSFSDFLQDQLLSHKILSTFSRLMVPHRSSFIIEEPEQNLYPSTQMDLLDLVVELCNGERKHHCTITTHSPYILNQLNLLVKRFDVGATDCATLNWEEISVWAVKDGEVRDLKVRNAHLINPEYLSEPLDRIYEEYEKYETTTGE